MKKALLCLLLAAALPAFANSWNQEFSAFEEKDVVGSNIVFLGSSSIRMWRTLEADFSFADAKVLNRGFGGSTMKECAAYTDKLLLKQRPQYVIIYAGDNDLAAGAGPEDVIDSLSVLVRNVRSITPNSRIAYISIKPSPARENLLPLVKKTNEMAKNWSKSHDVVFIDVYSRMMTQGVVRPELFLEDRLHMNHLGYEIWTQEIKAALGFSKYNINTKP